MTYSTTVTSAELTDELEGAQPSSSATIAAVARRLSLALDVISSRMFEQQSDLRYPTDDMQLWRYVTSERLLDLLTSDELYFTHVLEFLDGLKGSLTNLTRDHLFTWFKAHVKVDEASAQELVKRYEEAQEDFYVSCWHMNDFESYLMWKRMLSVDLHFGRLISEFRLRLADSTALSLVELSSKWILRETVHLSGTPFTW